MVTKVEMLKNQEAINKVLRTQQTEKSLKTLKVIQLLKFKTRRTKKDEEQVMGAPVCTVLSFCIILNFDIVFVEKGIV